MYAKIAVQQRGHKREAMGEFEVQSADQLANILNSFGIRFLTARVTTEPIPALSPAELLKGLITCPDARLRLAIIPLLLYRPDLAPRVNQAALELDEPTKSYLELFYTAAMFLQQEHLESLTALLGPKPPLLDLFSRDLMIATAHDPRIGLTQLAERHRNLSGLSINWLGTYEHAAERLIKRLKHEVGWARLPQAK